jgi:hypothetical protein
MEFSLFNFRNILPPELEAAASTVGSSSLFILWPALASGCQSWYSLKSKRIQPLTRGREQDECYVTQRISKLSPTVGSSSLSILWPALASGCQSWYSLKSKRIHPLREEENKTNATVKSPEKNFQLIIIWLYLCVYQIIIAGRGGILAVL